MRIERLDTQSLSGMSAETLKAHYAETKEKYLNSDTKDTRTQAYLATINDHIQKAEGDNQQ
ncbi:hypothetical protein [Virgibacillus necropolis]|uniref:Uncharacterized protein n=1 Tax=Virgibacillus necropolis TaxID=163877 RepID=A0A221MCH9_9BACI|nr:hypothetical protein [Virgibacillus necropolis]ASN05310.1 hypothetical protein CFK40_09940 [Virgibacillus necropolis]